MLLESAISILLFGPCGGRYGSSLHQEEQNLLYVQWYVFEDFVDGLEAVGFTIKKGFIIEKTHAGAAGDFENAAFVLSQNKYLGTITACLNNLNQSKWSYHISLATI